MSDHRHAERLPIKAKVEFIVDADVVNATTVNVSETGVRFDTHSPINILLRMTIDEKLHEHHAKLVWAKKNEDGSMTYGFEYNHEDVPRPAQP